MHMDLWVKLLERGHQLHGERFRQPGVEDMFEVFLRDVAKGAPPPDDRDALLRAPQHDLEVKFGELLGAVQAGQVASAGLAEREAELRKEMKFVKRRREVVARCLGALAAAYSQLGEIPRAEELFEQAIKELIECSGSSGDPPMVSAELVRRIAGSTLADETKHRLVALAFEQYPGRRSHPQYARALAGWGRLSAWDRGLEAASALSEPDLTAETLIELATVAASVDPSASARVLAVAQQLLDAAPAETPYAQVQWAFARLNAASVRDHIGDVAAVRRELSRTLTSLAAPQTDEFADESRHHALSRLAQVVVASRLDGPEAAALLDAAWRAIAWERSLEAALTAAVAITWARREVAPDDAAWTAMLEQLRALIERPDGGANAYFRILIEARGLISAQGRIGA